MKISFKVSEEIRFKYFTDNYTQKQLADEYQISQPYICRIVNNKKRTKPLASEMTVEERLLGKSGITDPEERLDRDQVQDIERFYRSGNFSCGQLARIFNVSQDNISRILELSPRIV